MSNPMKRTTMRQVAKTAGVSAMTVSKALGGKPGVSEETRRRILEIAENLDYTPNMLAKSFRTDQTNTIGVIMSSSFEEAFTILFRGIEATAAELGFSTLVATSGEEAEQKERIIQMLVGKRVDGMILTSAHLFSEKERSLLLKTGVPFVLAIRSCNDSTITTVVNNNYMGGFNMVDYLASTGSRCFVFLALAEKRCSSRERLRGWTEALRRHGLDIRQDCIVHVEASIDDGYAAMKRFLDKNLDFDAVVCGSDLIATGAMEALIEAGVAIPGQVRIGGYDGIPLSAHLRVPLTTIQQPLYEIGQISMRLLAEKIRNASAPAQQVVINGNLVIRAST